MAKRYHQSKKDHKHEGMGMHRFMVEEKYAGMESRRHQEMHDAGFISEDHSAIANLPQNVVMRPYGGDYGANMPEGLDDTIRGIDNQMGADDRKRQDHFKPHKY